MTRHVRSLLGTDQLTSAQITSYIKLARDMDPRNAQPWLQGYRVILLFYEASTRTRTSFEFAAKALGATTSLITAASSSIEKGESLIDTGWTLASLGGDAIVVRHPNSGAPYLLSRYSPVPVINAGDGLHQHPSQALLDALTIANHTKSFKGLRVVIVGDVFHSRVARSNAFLLTTMGAQVIFCGPPDLVPDIAALITSGVTVCHNLEAALRGADVVMSLRVQRERLAGKEISAEEYVDGYQIDARRMRLANPDAILLHPGPIIRGMELSSDVADGPQSCILEQVSNGVKMRMAILATALGKVR